MIQVAKNNKTLDLIIKTIFNMKNSLSFIYLFILLLIMCSEKIYSQSPQDLNTNVTTALDDSSVGTIASSFNQARREEEMQLGLGANAINDLVMPTQATWNAFSDDQKALYLLNDERTARAGINYGAGLVKGLPFNGIEANIDAVAQAWAQYNVDNNIVEHCHPNPNTDCPIQRINAAFPTGCTEFGGGIENLFASSQGTSFSTEGALLQAIYGWNYQDANSGWGHRQANLSQSHDDNYGDPDEEGLVGFGIAQTDNPNVTWKTVVVVKFADPSPAPACNTYNITVETPVGGAAGPQGHTCSTAFPISASGTYNAPAANQEMGAADQNIATHAIWYRFTPPVSGMINVRSCNAGNNNNVMGGGHNHVYPSSSTCATVNVDVANVIHTTSNTCGNQTSTEDIPVTAGVPIYIEWDDADGGAAFTWILEYVNTGGGPCNQHETVNAPTTTGTTQASLTISTNGALTATSAIFSAPTINLNQGFNVPVNTTFETNQVGCVGGPVEDGSCAAPYTLTCGIPLNLSTVGAANSNWDDYGGGQFYSSPENVHVTTVPANATVTLTLSDFNLDLDMFVSLACDDDPLMIIGSAETLNNPEQVILQNPNATPTMIYIIVETYGDPNGDSYTLSCSLN